ncbi:3'(2'),5'-bisphosphate nucleotidase CysQ [Nocardia speluncae]|uniref:3'(2'),5-bisphosphonucleoside 3'(2')-phosphohydrolase n=1 Tax=Nocardia speluncae TaxID=419477 RepID=A0A846XEH9_9NOCA|nr:3'(2'),5'-bisphosphate nucleotidase CysQ [Nocardia speluncae]NKY33126.1 3'(2'),5'-bisphosphate nucleotidase CysQ [Nocardia speluncae]
MTALPVCPDSVAGGDDTFARWLAERTGDLLLRVRVTGLEGSALANAGDAAAHDLLIELFARYRPHDAVLSEEGRDDRARTAAHRVWIVDPVDGTREFSEPPRQDWAVHVALWEGGNLVAGAVALPAAGITYATDIPPRVAARTPGPLRIAVSRSRPPAFVAELAGELGAELVPMGSAGVKAISVVRNLTDAYVHAGGQYEWDSAAPVAVARAAGLHTSRADGSPLRYNQADVLLPDLLVCRPEVAQQISSFIRSRKDPMPAD